MSINLNSRNNTLCCKVNDLYTALMASELLNDCVDDVVVMLKTCVDYVNIVSSQEVQIQHARFTMDGEEFRQYVMELDRHRRALHEGLMARVNFANRLCVKLNTPVLAEQNQEANSYTDQTCYNAAYCYGYVDGATMALNTLSGVPERHKCYAILSHYSNEDIGTFDSVAICGGVHMSFESAKKAADEMLAVDKENGCHDDAVPYTLDDCKEFDDLPLYIAGEWVKDKFEHYHNFYAVFEQDAAL